MGEIINNEMGEEYSSKNYNNDTVDKINKMPRKINKIFCYNHITNNHFIYPSVDYEFN